jgi:hypothetical protein
VTDPQVVSFVAECFWPGVTEEDLRALDDRIEASTAEGDQVRYAGSILMREDEVVLCLFEGTGDAVRRAAERAGVPFERILESSHSPWPDSASAREFSSMQKKGTR